MIDDNGDGGHGDDEDDDDDDDIDGDAENSDTSDDSNISRGVQNTSVILMTSSGLIPVHFETLSTPGDARHISRLDAKQRQPQEAGGHLRIVRN